MKIDKKIIMTVTLLSLVMQGCSLSFDNESSIKQDYYNEIPLLCSTSLYKYGEHLYVTKQSGWSIIKNKFFKKGDRVVFIRACSRIEDTVYP